MGIISKIKEKIYFYYFKKGVRIALKELTDKNSAEKNIPKMLSDINKIILGIEEEIDLFTKAHHMVEFIYGEHEEAAQISTIFPFLNLSMIDILVLHKQYLSTDDSIEKNFICRTAAQHMYEFLEDGSEVLGKQMNYLTNQLDDAEINNQLKALSKSLKYLRREFLTPLKKLRNNVSAHKDRDIKNQLAIRKSINVVDFHNRFILFMEFFITLNLFKNSFMEKMVKLKSSDNSQPPEHL